MREVDSTNAYASRLLSKNEPSEGTVIWADYQTAGRGQHQSRWESAPASNLMLTYILYPVFLPLQRMFMLNECVSIAVAETIQELSGTTAWIKWPNDIIVKQKKIAGVLLENTIRNSNLAKSICGIGININQLDFETYFPSAISLSELTGKHYDLIACFKVLNQHFKKWYTYLMLGKYDMISVTYHEKLFRRGILSSFMTVKGNLEGVISGVTEDGLLEIVTETSTDQFFEPKTLKLLTY